MGPHTCGVGVGGSEIKGHMSRCRMGKGEMRVWERWGRGGWGRDATLGKRWGMGGGEVEGWSHTGIPYGMGEGMGR